MARFFNLPRSWQVLAAIAAAGLVTGSFRLGGLLGTAAQVTAYAAAVLAFGAIALAAGVVGMYAELREASQQLTRSGPGRRACVVRRGGGGSLPVPVRAPWGRGRAIPDDRPRRAAPGFRRRAGPGRTG